LTWKSEAVIWDIATMLIPQYSEDSEKENSL